MLKLHFMWTLMIMMWRLSFRTDYIKILLLYVNLLHIDHIFDNIAVILYVEHTLQLCSYQCLTSTQAIQPVLLTIGFSRLACSCLQHAQAVDKGGTCRSGMDDMVSVCTCASVQ